MSTMREVAALAGVSGKTVSRVINDDRYVSDAVRSRVASAIETLGYVPNMLAQTFRTGRDSAIGIAVPDIADPFFGSVIQAVSDVARARSTAVLVTGLGSNAADEQLAVEALLLRNISGLIVAPNSADHAYLARWTSSTQVVFIDRPPRRITADSVVEDDAWGAEAATDRLIARGHRRIAFIGNGAAAATTERRRAGYRAALAAGGIAVDPALECLYQELTELPESMRGLLSQVDPATAIFSSNSRASTTLIPALHHQGRTDVAFVSFGDFQMAGELQPAVTVVDQHPAELGAIAAERLFLRIDRPTLRLKRSIVLPVALLVRDTSELPPRSSAALAGRRTARRVGR